MITEGELRQLTNCQEFFREKEHKAPPLFSQPSVPLGDLGVKNSSKFLIKFAPTSWELPPFASIGVPGSEKKEKKDENTAPQIVPNAFAEIGVKDDSDLPDPSLRPLPTRNENNFSTPDAVLPIPFSLRRYHTQHKGFFQIAAYGGQDDYLFAERYFNTLKLAAPNRLMLDGLGKSAFLTFLPYSALESEQPEKKFNLETAQGKFSFADIAPKGEVNFEELDPNYIKAKSSPTFSAIPVGDLPASFEETLRIQLVKQRFRGVVLKDAPLNVTRDDKNLESTTIPADNQIDEESEKTSDTNIEAKSEDLNPFAVKTNIQRDLKGMYVVVIYYPQQSLVCELAIDTRCSSLQSFLNIALLVQNRVQRW